MKIPSFQLELDLQLDYNSLIEIQVLEMNDYHNSNHEVNCYIYIEHDVHEFSRSLNDILSVG